MKDITEIKKSQQDLNGPKLLVFNEKHGDCYYLINNFDQVHEVCLKKLKERKEAKWYDHIAFEEAPDESDREYKNWKRRQLIYQSIDKAIEEEDKEQAYVVLRFFSNEEYSGFNVHKFLNV